MLERWHSLDRETQLVLLIAGGFVVYRIVVASMSGFGFHQGWNEGHYALIGRGFLHHPLVPRYGDRYVYSVPPLFPYTIAASFLAFGQSVLAARLPSIVATGILIVSTYYLGRSVFDDRRTALFGSLLLAVLPYVQLYGGRAQTDVLMTSLMTAALAAIVRGYNRETGREWLILGGGLFAAAVAAKQPALLLAPIVLGWLLGERRWKTRDFKRTGILILASAIFLLPLVVWMAYNYLVAPSAFVGDWRHELVGRTAPFANVPLLIVVGFALGMTPLVLTGTLIGFLEDMHEVLEKFQSEVRRGPSVLTWWLVVFGAFVFVRTPHGHQYYAVALTPPIALFAARGIRALSSRATEYVTAGPDVVESVMLVLVLLSAISGTIVLFELSGEFSVAEGGGTHVAPDAGQFIVEEVPSDAIVMVSNGYGPPIRWYVRGQFPFENVTTYRVPTLSEGQIRQLQHNASGPVYLLYPDPSWGTLPVENATIVYRTDAYEYTVMSLIGSWIQTDSKFTYYLNDRRLVVYRISSEESAFRQPASVDTGDNRSVRAARGSQRVSVRDPREDPSRAPSPEPR